MLLDSHEQKQRNSLTSQEVISRIPTMHIQGNELIWLCLGPLNISSKTGLNSISLLPSVETFSVEGDPFCCLLLTPRFVLPFALLKPAICLKARRRRSKWWLTAVVTYKKRIWWVQIVLTGGVNRFRTGEETQTKGGWTRKMVCNPERSVDLPEDNHETAELLTEGSSDD